MKRKIRKVFVILAAIVLLVVLLVGGYTLYGHIKVDRILSAHEDPVTTTTQTHTGPKRSVQQIMIGTLCNNYDNALQTLQNIKASGYDGIELNDFMIQKTALVVKLLTQAAGMPVGNGGNLDWHSLIQESGLEVTGLHSNLGSIEADPQAVADMAKSFGTDTVIITGMYRFDYSSEAEVTQLAQRLNDAGRALAQEGIQLLYHNHNCELQKVNASQTAYDILIENTDPDYVNFEFDSYWMADGGADVAKLMQKLGTRMKKWHVNDRGHAGSGPYMTPILDQDATELGNGNMDLEGLYEIAAANGVDTIVLETHRNWINGDPIQSIQNSGAYMQEHFN